MSMSAKILYSIAADDNPAVQKQLGCMNGILQLFDRHHFLSSRRISRDHHKRLPECKHDAETNESSRKSSGVAAKNPQLVVEKQRISTDSSRSSISSSCNSSSLSSLDETKSAKSEHTPLHRSSYSGRSGRPKVTLQRDVTGITAKSSGGRKEPPTLTYIDSPRPMQKPNKPAKTRFLNLQESLGALPNFRKLRTSTDSIEYSRKDSPRLSYDGRESRDALRSRLKELPRHSLDSKRSQIRQSDNLVVDSPREAGIHRRQSSLVAKLMGLETLPDPEELYGNGSVVGPGEAFDHSRSSSRVGSSNFPKKRNPSSRFPLEPAPWKKPEGNSSEAQQSNSSRSVYGEIEKRLAQLEFKKSGKDLRALKQILEAMQKSKEKLDTQKDVAEKSSSVSNDAENPSRGPQQRYHLAAMTRSIRCESPSSPAAATRTGSPRTPPSSAAIAKTSTGKKSNNGPRTEDRPIRRNSSGRTVPLEKINTCRETPKEPVSLRMQKKKLDPLDYSRGRTSRPGRKTSRAASLLIGSYDQGSEVSGESFSRDRNISVSLRSEGNISMSSYEEEAEVTSSYSGTRKILTSPSQLGEDMLIGKPRITTSEQPSPISVLDATLYGDESPSPVKMISNAFQDIAEPNIDESRWNQVETKSASIGKEYGITNPDHNYILEFLFNRNGIQGIIAPSKCSDELQRRLLYDLVDEILVDKFVISKNWAGRRKNNQQQLLHGLCSEIDKLRANNGSSCSSEEEEDDDWLRHIIEKDLSNQSAIWADGFGDVSGVVLDIERLIFKDLIREVVSGAAGHVLRARHAANYCRQLF